MWAPRVSSRCIVNACSSRSGKQVLVPMEFVEHRAFVDEGLVRLIDSLTGEWALGPRTDKHDHMRHSCDPSRAERGTDLVSHERERIERDSESGGTAEFQSSRGYEAKKRMPTGPNAAPISSGRPTVPVPGESSSGSTAPALGQALTQQRAGAS